MTTEANDNYNTSEFKLTNPQEKELMRIMFEERAGVSSFFEKSFNVRFGARTETSVELSGAAEDIAVAKKALVMMVANLIDGKYVGKGMIKMIRKEIAPEKKSEETLAEKFENSATPGVGTAPGGKFVPRNKRQDKFANAIDNNLITFGLGPAGTGKTHVAVAKAIEALKAGKVKKIILIRPAVESGENLGFLPGDQLAKLDPYMRPFYDEFDKSFGVNKYKKMIEDKIIEVGPVGFAQGRTFDDAFIIIDEGQNLTRVQTKMLLTRPGNNSKVVMLGDPSYSQTLISAEHSGLRWAVDSLGFNDLVASVEFTEDEVVRSLIAQMAVKGLKIETQSPVKAARQEQDFPDRGGGELHSKKSQQNKGNRPG